MANTLTGLIPTIYNALDVVSRELTGLIPAVSSDMTYERAAVGQTVTSHVAPAATAADITPGVTPPNDGDQTIGSVSMTITKSRRCPIRWNGEEKRGLDNNGASFNIIFRDQVAQAMRTLVNEIEAALAAQYIGASRATGAAGTTPFASTLADPANLVKLLNDNGAPTTDRSLVIDTTAGAKMRTLTQLNKVNEADDSSLLRRGTLLELMGFAVRESAQIVTAVSGTGASATTNTAGYAVGATSITLAAAGTGTILAGDVITFASDTANQYVVKTGTGAVSGATIVLAAPGLRKAIPASAQNITVVAASTRNMAFSRNALALATRAPALPAQGDVAADRQIVTDAVSGLSFEIAMYPQYRQMQYEVAIAYGTAVIKPEHLVLLLG